MRDPGATIPTLSLRILRFLAIYRRARLCDQCA
jgi:hypothetical protein